MADPYEQELANLSGRQLLARAMQMYGQQPDVTALNEYAAQRQRQGQMDMVNALAAQYAGKGFQPVQETYLKRSLAAQTPQEIGDYGIVAGGKFTTSPFAGRKEQATGLLSMGNNILDNEEAMARQNAADRRAAAREAASDARAAARERASMERLQLMLDTRFPKADVTDLPRIAEDATPKIITPDVDAQEAVGATGFWQHRWGQLGDAFGLGSPDNPNRKATERMQTLANQTQLYLQDAVPGRPSNYLLQMMEKQTIRPNELFTGAATGSARTQATIAVLDTGLNDLAGVIKNPQASKDDKAKAVASYKRLSQLKAEYNSLGQSFAGPEARPRNPQIDEILKQYSNPGTP